MVNYTGEVTKKELENRNIAYKTALESIALLKNENVLPLKNPNIVLYGSGSVFTIKGGAGSGDVNSREPKSIYDEFNSNGFNVLNKEWINNLTLLKNVNDNKLRDEISSDIKNLNINNIVNDIFKYPEIPYLSVSKEPKYEADTCFYIINRMSAENSDVKDIPGEYRVSDNELRDLVRLNREYQNVILILNTPCTFDLSFMEYLKNIKGVINYAFPGMEGPKALVDIVSGKVSPSGKLSVTWPKSISQIPYSLNYGKKGSDIFYTEDIFVGYKYYNSFDVEPLYPFGYGLSYTNFNIKTNDVNVSDNKVNISVNVTNTGSFTGKEVVECFIELPSNKIIKERHRLVGFIKTDNLKPNETKNYNLSFKLNNIASYDENTHANIIDSGKYVIKIGNCINNLVPVKNLEVKESILVTKFDDNNKIGFEMPHILYPIHKIKDNDLDNIEIIQANIKDEIIKINNPTKEISMVKQLGSVIGKGLVTFSFPGAVGEIKNVISERKILLSDGPAGLRLNQQTSINMLGCKKMVTPPQPAADYFPEILKKFFLETKLENKKIIYQYATAFPTELSLAQTWNLDLIKNVGEAISKEMDEFGIDYFLAPAVNIIKNPLCGRNYEYFSEDPLISGLCGKAVVDGININPNNKTTIKHFCCNNQETNREYYSANLSERALRELYLKPFEIIVKESNPASIMTSYNRVNGKYVANNELLCTNVLRDEWGFNGIVMTDWYSTGLKKASAIKAINAGNDLIMPGSPLDRIQILSGLVSGELDKEKLLLSANRIIDNYESITKVK